MPRKKLSRFAAVNNSPFVWDQEPKTIKKELKKLLNSYNGLFLELACGRGEYTIAAAQANPKQLCVGVDIQGERIWYGLQAMQQHSLTNIRFIRQYIDLIDQCISPKSVTDLWLVFPDPFPKSTDERKRLTHPLFLQRYKKILAPKGYIHLKTDNEALWNYSQESIAAFGGTILEQSADVDVTPVANRLIATQTYFETKHRVAGRKIHYLRFRV